MFIDVFTNKNGQKYLRLVESARVENALGKKISQKRLVKHIGPMERFDDGKPDYIKRLRDSFKAGRPLIGEIEPYCSKHDPIQKYHFIFTEGESSCFGEPKLVAHLLVERIMEYLGLHTFFRSYKNLTKIEYNIYSFAKLMVTGRILNPASKVCGVS